MASSITVTLDIADDGRVSLRQPGGAQESFEAAIAGAAKPKPRKPRPPEFDVPFDMDYGPKGKRKGYRADYLGAGFEVPLPNLNGLVADATRLINPGKGDPHRLDYRGYSLVMHEKRKFPIYTAANLDGGNRYKLGRPHDNWRYDPRIPQSSQIGDFYYYKNQFDKGHMTRYEDMEYGPTVIEAVQSAADTLHYTNCVPQHAEFNERQAQWQGLEQNVLEQAIKANAFRALVFTGPVLDPGDPAWDRYPEILYPVRFWKIAVAVTSANRLFAAGFILDQSEVIARFGIEAAVAVPFAPFKTFQVPIAEIERVTGLSFPAGADGSGSLNDFDPLRAGGPAAAAAARRPVAVNEATAAGDAVPYGYVPLDDPSDMILG